MKTSYEQFKEDVDKWWQQTLPVVLILVAIIFWYISLPILLILAVCWSILKICNYFEKPKKD